MRIRSRPFALISAFSLVGAFGCAHETPMAQTPPPAPPPIVAKAVPAEESATQAQKEDAAALARVLNGPIAYFAFDKSDLTAEDQQKLTVLARELKAHSTAHILIAGNTDEVGTEEYNLQLGQRRAQVARTYLVALGIPEARLDTVSYGEDRPADPGHDAAAYAKNRRDEVSTR